MGFHGKWEEGKKEEKEGGRKKEEREEERKGARVAQLLAPP